MTEDAHGRQRVNRQVPTGRGAHACYRHVLVSLVTRFQDVWNYLQEGRISSSRRGPSWGVTSARTRGRARHWSGGRSGAAGPAPMARSTWPGLWSQDSKNLRVFTASLALPGPATGQAAGPPALSDRGAPRSQSEDPPRMLLRRHREQRGPEKSPGPSPTRQTLPWHVLQSDPGGPGLGGVQGRADPEASGRQAGAQGSLTLGAPQS